MAVVTTRAVPRHLRSGSQPQRCQRRRTTRRSSPPVRRTASARGQSLLRGAAPSSVLTGRSPAATVRVRLAADVSPRSSATVVHQIATAHHHKPTRGHPARHLLRTEGQRRDLLVCRLDVLVEVHLAFAKATTCSHLIGQRNATTRPVRLVGAALAGQPLREQKERADADPRAGISDRHGHADAADVGRWHCARWWALRPVVPPNSEKASTSRCRTGRSRKGTAAVKLVVEVAVASAGQ